MLIRADGTATKLEEDVHEIKEEMKELSKVMTKIAVQTERMDALSTRMNLLERRQEMRGKQWPGIAAATLLGMRRRLGSCFCCVPPSVLEASSSGVGRICSGAHEKAPFR